MDKLKQINEKINIKQERLNDMETAAKSRNVTNYFIFINMELNKNCETLDNCHFDVGIAKKGNRKFDGFQKRMF